MKYFLALSLPLIATATFDIPQYKALLAWAGHRKVDLLTTQEEIASLGNPKDGPKINRATGQPVQSKQDPVARPNNQ